jgi:hypothetical protein
MRTGERDGLVFIASEKKNLPEIAISVLQYLDLLLFLLTQTKKETGKLWKHSIVHTTICLNIPVRPSGGC